MIDGITITFATTSLPTIAHALRQLAGMIEDRALPAGVTVVALRGRDNELVGAATLRWDKGRKRGTSASPD